MKNDLERLKKQLKLLEILIILFIFKLLNKIIFIKL